MSGDASGPVERVTPPSSPRPWRSNEPDSTVTSHPSGKLTVAELPLAPVEAYAQTGQWEQAYQLSETAHGIGFGAGAALCNVWQQFAQFNSTAETLTYTEKAKTEFCTAGNQ